MKACVYGAGGVGGYFGARLAEAGMDVTLVARGAHAQSIKVNGLRLSSINGDALIHNVKVVEKPESGAGFQLAIVAVKAWQVEEAASALRESMAEGGVALPLQNGVDAPDQLAAALGDDRAIAGLCGLVSFIQAPGHIAHTQVDLNINWASEMERYRRAASNWQQH
jgi:2-dehydropantoate 2-reductase